MSQNYIWPAVTITPGGGGATSANQVLEIAQLTAINTNTAESLTDAELRATPVPVSGPLTDTQLRATAVPVSGPLTDTQLRATPVPVSGTVSTGGLTDAQLRATAVPVSLTSTTITGSVAVTGPLTDTQLRATAVPVSLTSTTVTGTVAISAASLPLPTGASTEATLSTLNGKVPANLTVTSTRLLVDGSGVTQPVSIAATVTTAEVRSSSSAITSVGGSASSVSILASNASRKGAAVYNDSTAVLYLKLGATASTTSYTVQLVAGAYYELPTTSVYTGAIDGIWASATGNARITELS